MNAASVKTGIRKISRIMAENKDYLIKLDQQNGDGDLGVSMSEGFEAAAVFVEGTSETDLGKILMQTGGVFNEAAPSSLGTIISFAFMGMAKSLKGKTEAGLPEFAEAVMAGRKSWIRPVQSLVRRQSWTPFIRQRKACWQIGTGTLRKP